MQELEETAYWMELLEGKKRCEGDQLEPLTSEANQLMAIFVTIYVRLKLEWQSASFKRFSFHPCLKNSPCQRPPISLEQRANFIVGVVVNGRPQAARIEVVNSLAYLVGLYEQKRITLERALHALTKTTRRGTLRPEWIQSAIRVVAEIRRKGKNE